MTEQYEFIAVRKPKAPGDEWVHDANSRSEVDYLAELLDHGQRGFRVVDFFDVSNGHDMTGAPRPAGRFTLMQRRVPPPKADDGVAQDRYLMAGTALRTLTAADVESLTKSWNLP